MPSLPRTLPRICVALGLPTAEGLLRAAEREIKDGSAFLEFRLDALKDPESGLPAITSFVQKHPDVPVLATCRHREHAGGFRGVVEQQVSILQRAADAGATLIDLEIESAECVPEGVARLRQHAPVLISFHDWERTPALAPILRRLQRIPADAYKIATTAVKPSDNLRLAAFARSKQPVPLIALAMSEMGAVTRILSPALGSAFTYAAPSEGAGTAPGQVAARSMRMLYRSDKLTAKTRVYGVIADPVAHSKSPQLHNRAFQARRIDAVYIPFRVGAQQLSDFMKLAGELPVAGFSVTIPHKQRIMRYLDTVDPLAKRIGAVNTVWRKSGKWRGANTDAQGVVQPLSQHVRLAHASVLVAGYGGAARAAAIALAEGGSRVTITGRRLESARQLARVIKADAISLADAAKGHFDALVHATPVGMTPDVDGCLFDDRIPAAVVLDMVYNPHETVLLKRARAQGATPIHGLDMLLEQAACQFEIWTGESAPRSVMHAAVMQAAAMQAGVPSPGTTASPSGTS